jgi:hypothetical protein
MFLVKSKLGRKRPRLFASKKGQIDDLFDLVFTILALFFAGVSLFLYLTFTVSAAQEQTNAYLDDFELEQGLSHYMRSSFILENEGGESGEDGKGSESKGISDELGERSYLANEVIVHGVEVSNWGLFEAHAEAHFESTGYEGIVIVYSSNEFLEENVLASYRAGSGIFTRPDFYAQVEVPISLEEGLVSGSENGANGLEIQSVIVRYYVEI